MKYGSDEELVDIDLGQGQDVTALQEWIKYAAGRLEIGGAYSLWESLMCCCRPTMENVNVKCDLSPSN